MNNKKREMQHKFVSCLMLLLGRRRVEASLKCIRDKAARGKMLNNANQEKKKIVMKGLFDEISRWLELQEGNPFVKHNELFMLVSRAKFH